MSPASSSTMSPGTTWAEGTTDRTPSRSTFALGEDMAFRLSRDFSALKCWTVPSTALRIRTAKMTTVLSTLSDTMEIRAAMMRITTSRSLNWSRNTWSPDFFLPSARAFLPCFWRRSAASLEVSPAFVPPRALRVSSTVRLKNEDSTLATLLLHLSCPIGHKTSCAIGASR